MIRIDTDHLSVLLDPRDSKRVRLIERLEQSLEELGVPILCIEEQLRAWLAQIRRFHDPHKQIAPYTRLAKLIDFTHDWQVIEWDEAAADVFVQLRSARLKVGTQDLKIAALAITAGALLLSANLRDFRQVSRLRVEDWLYD